MDQSYELEMMRAWKMPSRDEVEQAILTTLFHHNGVVKEFHSKESVVDEIAEIFHLTKEQRTAQLQTFYHKENRVKYSGLWHRLLFRAADQLAKKELISRPSETLKLTEKREWMLKERGFEEAARLLSLSTGIASTLPVKTFEVQEEMAQLKSLSLPLEYNPQKIQKEVSLTPPRKIQLRRRGFRLAIIEAYDYRCAVCGLKLPSPNGLTWEVEAAHIVPFREKGKDDLWNGLALCRFHHWAFDAGWFTMDEKYQIFVAPSVSPIKEIGFCHGMDMLQNLRATTILYLPNNKNWFPHPNALKWHQKHVFARHNPSV
ncbi:MAG: HNH endonuclease [Planctomycetia bacterium]|nr:HNH endonuclease [Planctomycetia bacterium]